MSWLASLSGIVIAWLTTGRYAGGTSWTAMAIKDNNEFFRTRAELSTRLRHACEHLSDTEFSRLVDDIARMRERFARIESDPRGHVALRLSELETTENR